MKTLMVDMDNVITDGVFKSYIEEFYHTKINLDEVGVYSYVQELTKDRSKEFWEYVKTKNFYCDAPLLEGCYDVLKKLNEKYDIYIVTSYLWNEDIDLSGDNLKNKYDYLRKMLPFIPPEKYIFSTTKDMMNFDIRIDDRVMNLCGSKIKLLFSAWHNRNISFYDLKKDGIIRVDCWYDIEQILLGNS